jgi:hypothetical protein
MKKEVIRKFGKNYYLLGKRKIDGKKVWLEESSFDCGWYWGIGYVEVFTKKYYDIEEHTHFDSLFLTKNIYDSFIEYFQDITIEKDEVWQLLELMKTAYIAREYSDMLNCCGSNITQNVCSSFIASDKEYKRINEVVIPEILKNIYKLLGGVENVV